MSVNVQKLTLSVRLALPHSDLRPSAAAMVYDSGWEGAQLCLAVSLTLHTLLEVVTSHSGYKARKKSISLSSGDSLCNRFVLGRVVGRYHLRKDAQSSESCTWMCVSTSARNR